MGQMLMTLGGAALGSLVGMPQLGAMIGGAAGGALFGPTTEGPRLKDLSVSTSTYGNAIPRLFGSARLNSNMIWSDGIKEHAKNSSIGKGGGSVKEYSYTASFAIVFCEGPITDILRIWADSKLLGDATGEALRQMNSSKESHIGEDLIDQILNVAATKAQFKGAKVRVYRGTETQMPDPLMERKLGKGNVSAYRGLCYAVFEDLKLEDFGNRIPNITAEITKSPNTSRPTIQFENADGTKRNSNGVPDWPSMRSFVDTGDGYINAYSLVTSKQVGRWKKPDLGKYARSPGGEVYAAQPGPRNANPVIIYDGNTLSEIAKWGYSGNNLTENYGDPCRNLAPETAAFVALGTMNVFRVSQMNGYGYFFMNVNGFRTGSIWTTTGAFVRYLPRTGAVLQLGEYEGKTEFMLWGADTASDRIWYDLYTLKANAAATKSTFPSLDCDTGSKTVFYEDTIGCAIEQGAIAFPAGRINPSVTLMLYCRKDNTLVLFCRETTDDPTIGNNMRSFVFKYSLDNGAITYVSNLYSSKGDNGQEYYVGGPSTDYKYSNIVGNRMRWAEGSRVITLNFDTGESTAETYGQYHEHWGAFYDEFSDSLFTSQNGRHERVFFTTEAGETSVSSIVSEILSGTGILKPTDYDVSALESIKVTGYVMSRDATARDCLQQIATAFFFDGVESDYKLKMVSRGKPTKVAITEAQMGSVSDRDVQLNETLTNEIEMPMRITVAYLDRNRDYQVGTQFAKRIMNPYPTMNSKKEQKVELPVVMQASEAKKIADKLLKMSWAQRTSNEANLPWRFIKYDPTDVVSYTLDDGSSRTSRIVTMDIGDDLTLKVTGANDSPTAYTSVVEAVEGRTVPYQGPAPTTPVKLALINTPLLRDVDDTQGVGSMTYLSAVAPQGVFGGAYILEAEVGEDFSAAAKISVDPPAGYVTQPLPPTRNWNAIDRNLEIVVKLFNAKDALESITYEQFMAGRNMAVIGDEVIQFQNAVLDENGSWHLTNILRARRGTDYAVGSHVTGEMFIFLSDDGAIYPDKRATTAFGHLKELKAVPPGLASEDVTGFTYTLDPNDLRPYSPADFVFHDDNVNVTVSFSRRSRITYGINDFESEAHYREGQAAAGFFSYQVWAGAAVTDKPWNDPAKVVTSEGTIPLLVDGVFKSPSVTLPIDTVTTDEFIIAVAEHGFAKGFPAYRHVKRAVSGDWNVTELFS
jgi:hypothetical protein